jgi:hypothetical protein
MDQETLDSVNENGEAMGTGNDARIAFLEQINDANDALRADELAEINDDGTTSDFVLDATTQQELDRAEEEANQIGEPEPEFETAPTKHRIKVNGRELELSTEELIARAQKIEAADQYLVEAARLKREAENRIQPQVVTPQGPTQEELLEERRALVRAIQMGTEEEAMEALEKLRTPVNPALNADVLARTVDDRLTFKTAIQRFETDYQDILGDPVLRQLALQTDQNLLAQGDTRDYWSRYQAIGNDLRAWKQTLAPQPQAQQSAQPANSKLERKAAAPAAPKAASARAPAARQDDEGDESIQDVIANIARARGGYQYAR